MNKILEYIHRDVKFRLSKEYLEKNCKDDPKAYEILELDGLFRGNRLALRTSDGIGTWVYLSAAEVVPILRPLESLTAEELKLFSSNFRMYYQREDLNVDLMIVKDYNLALSLHLDLFGLIEAGLAANKN